MSNELLLDEVISMLDEAFDNIQSEAVDEDMRAAEKARIKQIPAFRLLVEED